MPPTLGKHYSDYSTRSGPSPLVCGKACCKIAKSLAGCIHLVMVTVHSHEPTVGFIPGLQRLVGTFASSAFPSPLSSQKQQQLPKHLKVSHHSATMVPCRRKAWMEVNSMASIESAMPPRSELALATCFKQLEARHCSQGTETGRKRSQPQFEGRSFGKAGLGRWAHRRAPQFVSSTGCVPSVPGVAFPTRVLSPASCVFS